jgi:tape measure domain-containing protein
MNSAAASFRATTAAASRTAAAVSSVSAPLSALSGAVANVGRGIGIMANGVQQAAGHLYNLSAAGTAGMQTTGAAINGVASLTQNLAQRLGLVQPAASGAAQSLSEVGSRGVQGLLGVSASANQAGGVMGMFANIVRGSIGLLGGVTASAVAFGAAALGTAAPAAGALASAMGSIGAKASGISQSQGPLQSIISLLQRGVTAAMQFAAGLASAVGKATGLSTIASAAGGIMKFAAGGVAMFAQAKAMMAMQQSLEHLTSGIVDFNAKLQTARVAFDTLFTNEIRRAVTNVGSLSKTLNGFTDENGKAVAGINDKWRESISVYAQASDLSRGVYAGERDQAMKTQITVEQMIDSWKELSAVNKNFGDSLPQTEAGLTQLASTNAGAFNQIVENTDSAKQAADDYVTLLKNYANVTPFRFPELLDMAKKMRGLGFTTEETLPAINAIGDAVAAMGGNEDQMQRIGYALGKMRNSGRVYAREMLQLSNAGLNGYDILAEGMDKSIAKGGEAGKSAQVLLDKAKSLGFDMSKGFTVESVRALTKIGAIGGKAASDALLQGMEDRFKGSQDRLSNTFGGAMSTIADVTQSTMAVAFEPFFQFIGNEDPKKGPMGLVQQLKDALLDPTLQTGAADFAKGMQEFFKSFNGDAEGGGAGKIVTAIANAFTIVGMILSTIVAPIIKIIVSYVSMWVKAVMGAADQIFTLFSAVGQLLDAVVTNYTPIFDSMLAPMTTILQSLATGLTSFVSAMMPVVTAALPVFGELISTVLQAIAFLMPIFDFIMAVIATVIQVAVAIGIVIAGLVQGIMNALMPIFNFIGKIFGALAAIMNGLNKSVGPAFMVLASIIGKAFSFIGSVLGGLIGLVFNPLGEAIGIVGSVIGGVLGMVGGIFETLANVVIDAINFMIKAYNALPFGDIAEIGHIKFSVDSQAKTGAEMMRDNYKTESTSMDDAFAFEEIVPGSYTTGATTPPRTGGGGGGTNWRKTFDERLKDWIQEVKSAIEKMYAKQIDAIKRAQEVETRRFEKAKQAANDFHDRVMRGLEDEKRAQSRIFEDRLRAIQDQKDALRDAQDERKATDKQAELERNLAYAVAQQASGTLDPLEAAKNVVDARKALEDFLVTQQEDAAMTLLDQQTQQIEDEKQVWERSYEDRATAEKRRFDDQMSRLDQEHKQLMQTMDDQIQELQDKMDRELLAFENHVMELAKKLKKGQISAKEFIKQTHAEFLKLGYTYKDIGEAIGMSIADGLRRSEKAVDTAAKRLAAIIAKYLKVQSPTEAGPLAVDQSKWGENLAGNMMGGMAKKFKDNLGLRMGIGDFANSLSNMKPMGLDLSATGGGTVQIMNFNFGADSVRSDRDIYALAEAVEKRVTRTLRQR